MTEEQNIYTIGFTQKSAQTFFELLKKSGVSRLLDTRLNNTGQLAGFSKRDDLAYFAKTIVAVEYVHWEESAPTGDALKAYKDKQISWDEYAGEYIATIARRKVEKSALQLVSHGACLLCSEAKPHHCHRSLLANYLSQKLQTPLVVKHL